jgi:type I site-specific restriction endonuclease
MEAVARGDKRVLLVMATGTGKTYTTFQIIWRLWKGGTINRALFLADRDILIDQALTNDFKPFGAAMTKVTGHKFDPAYEIFLGLYQAITGKEEEEKSFKKLSRDFFDLIVIDECHRGSAAEDALWREILDYFSGAIHIGMTATPKETKYVSNIGYFGEPTYTYSLKQGIEDGFLAPYKVIRIDIDKDIQGWRPLPGMTDDLGREVPDREYNQMDMDKILVLNQRTRLVARRVMQYLNATDPFAKTIIFCEDVDHADRMRAAIVNEPGKLAIEYPKYVMRITGDSTQGKAELDNFIDPESRFPVIATTSELLTTGVDARTCKLIVLDKTINSMTTFKQIIGRGTRILEEYTHRRCHHIRRPSRCKLRGTCVHVQRCLSCTINARHWIGRAGQRIRCNRHHHTASQAGRRHHRVTEAVRCPQSQRDSLCRGSDKHDGRIASDRCHSCRQRADILGHRDALVGVRARRERRNAVAQTRRSVCVASRCIEQCGIKRQANGFGEHSADQAFNGRC